MAMYALVNGERREVDCTSCAHYIRCPFNNSRCGFGSLLHAIADGDDPTAINNIRAHCWACGHTTEKSFQSWYCLYCNERLQFQDGLWAETLLHYEPGGGEKDVELLDLRRGIAGDPDA